MQYRMILCLIHLLTLYLQCSTSPCVYRYQLQPSSSGPSPACCACSVFAFTRVHQLPKNVHRLQLLEQLVADECRCVIVSTIAAAASSVDFGFQAQVPSKKPVAVAASAGDTTVRDTHFVLNRRELSGAIAAQERAAVAAP